MEKTSDHTDAVRSVFKNGRPPTKEAYTKLWIRLINHSERLKANHTDMQSGK